MTKCHLSKSPKLRTCLFDLVAAGADLDSPSNNGTTPMQLAVLHGVGALTACAAAKRRIIRTQLDIVRNRAFQVCVGLQSLSLDALQVCHILGMRAACGPVAPLVSLHVWWKIASTVKISVSMNQSGQLLATTGLSRHTTRICLHNHYPDLHTCLVETEPGRLVGRRIGLGPWKHSPM
jgi:hypothetical protein